MADKFLIGAGSFLPFGKRHSGGLKSPFVSRKVLSPRENISRLRDRIRDVGEKR